MIGYVLVAAAIGTDSLEPAVAKQAGLLGLEDPHWHAPTSAGAGESSEDSVL